MLLLKARFDFGKGTYYNILVYTEMTGDRI